MNDEADVLDDFVEAAWDRHVGNFDKSQSFRLLGDVSEDAQGEAESSHTPHPEL